MGRILGTKKTKKAVAVNTPNTSGSIGSYYDAYGRKRIPNDHRLIAEYKRTAFACANLNAAVCNCVPLRMFLRTDNRSKKSILETKSVSSSEKDRLTKLSYLQKTLQSATDIEEVIRHPLLDLLKRGNDSPFLNGQMLEEFKQLYLEITGKAYWLLELNPILKIPKNIWLLPSQWIRPIKEDSNSTTIIDYYEYSVPGANSKKLRPENVIQYLMPNLFNPYTDGLSPLQAAFESNEVNNKLLTHEDSLLENESRPDALLSPKTSDDAFGGDEAKSLEKRFKQRFGRGRSGGVWVTDDPVDLKPISWPPRDIARLEIGKWSKNDLANAFQVPFALIAEASHNRQQIEAAERQHAKYGISSRLNRDAAIKNDRLIPFYDNSGRLFLAYDNPVPEDQQVKDERIERFVMAGIWTPNEGRHEDGTFGPDPKGNDLRPINVSPEMMKDKPGNREGDNTD